MRYLNKAVVWGLCPCLCSLQGTFGNYLFFPQWSQLPDALGEVGATLGELRPHPRGIIKHLDSIRIDTDTLKDLFGPFCSGGGKVIAFHVVTVTQQTAGQKNTVSAHFKGLQDVGNVHPAGAGHFEDMDIGGVLHSHGAG